MLSSSLARSSFLPICVRSGPSGLPASPILWQFLHCTPLVLRNNSRPACRVAGQRQNRLRSGLRLPSRLTRFLADTNRSNRSRTAGSCCAAAMATCGFSGAAVPAMRQQRLMTVATAPLVEARQLLRRLCPSHARSGRPVAGDSRRDPVVDQLRAAADRRLASRTAACGRGRACTCGNRGRAVGIARRDDLGPGMPNACRAFRRRPSSRACPVGYVHARRRTTSRRRRGDGSGRS